MTRPRDDEGSVLFLVIGLSVVLMLLVAVVVDVSAVVLARRALVNAADGAALAAAQQADSFAITTDETALDRRLPLDAGQVRSVVATYQSDERAAQRGLVLSSRVEGGGTVAVIDARRTVKLPFGGWLNVGNVALHVTARAQSPVIR